MLTLGTIGGLTTLSMGGSKAQKAQGPPINAQSPDEESFIKYVITSESAEDDSKFHWIEACLTASREFLKNAEGDGKGGNNADTTKKDAGR